MIPKRGINWQIKFAAVLLFFSATAYLLHYALFRDLHHIFVYLIGDIGFLFLDVLIVTLALHQLLAFREKRALLKKLNMVIGTFFSEVGTDLLRLLCRFDSDFKTICPRLVITGEWKEKDFTAARAQAAATGPKVNSSSGDLSSLKAFLLERRPFLLSLLENPNLLEHESFTDLLWAVFHLTDELAHRREVRSLSEADYNHLSGDIRRAYRALILQWLDYMRHLKEDYPYLFSLAMRTNPFDEGACVEVS